MSAVVIGWRAAWNTEVIPPLQMPEGYELVKIRTRPGDIAVAFIRNKVEGKISSAAIHCETGELRILATNIRPMKGKENKNGN